MAAGATAAASTGLRVTDLTDSPVAADFPVAASVEVVALAEAVEEASAAPGKKYFLKLIEVWIIFCIFARDSVTLQNYK